MRTDRQKANLRRGQGPNAKVSAARARSAKAAHRAEDERIALVVQEDPEQALLFLHADLVVGTRHLTRKWLAAGGEPSRELISAWRELRMLSDRVIALLGARAPEMHAKEFLDGIASRIPDLERFAQTVEPLVWVEPPATVGA